MNKKSYVVDANLGAVRMHKLLKIRGNVRSKTPVTRRARTDRPVLSGKQDLQPNKLYVAANDPAKRYYLPSYRLAANPQGRPEVQLRYEPDDSGQIGRLSLTLTWDPPRARRGMRLQVMEHVVDLALRFQLPVQGGGNASVEEEVPLQPPQPTGDRTASSITVFTEKSQFDTVYQAMRDTARQPTLQIGIEARVGVRTWQQVVIGGHPTKAIQAEALKRRGALFTTTLSPESLATLRRTSGGGSSRARVRVTAPPQEEAERVRRMRLMMARSRTVTPVAFRRATTRPPTATTPSRRRVAARRTTLTPGAARILAAGVRRGRVTAVTTGRAGTSATTVGPPPRTVVRDRRTRTIVARPVFTSTTLSRVNAPVLARAVATSDLKIANKKAVPVKIALDPKGKPAIIDTDLENEQQVSFGFDPALPANTGVFATEGFDPGGIHLLLTLQLTSPSGRTHTVYQDNLMRDVIHVAPAEFRLMRDSETPFLPGLSFLPGDFSTTEDDTQAEVLFQVVMAYELEPWIDPEIVELARAELARQDLVARFTPILPREATLTLDLDLLGQAQRREEAAVEAAVGITDALVLDHNVFVRIWRERLANPSGGVSGRVDYQLFDGTQAQSAVAISLWQTSTDLFDVDFVGPVEGRPGRYRIRLRNRIESPAVISKLPREVVLEGVFADVVDADAVLGRRVEPQGHLDVEYQVTPAGAAVASIEPVVFGRVEPDLPALLRLSMVSPGYSSLGFALTVRAADGAFVPPAAGEEPLSGLLVEFDDGSRAELTSDLQETEVTLVGRLIDQILGTADDQQSYFYRVTNLHASGEGARTGWEKGQGVAPLMVGTAVVQLDF